MAGGVLVGRLEGDGGLDGEPGRVEFARGVFNRQVGKRQSWRYSRSRLVCDRLTGMAEFFSSFIFRR